MTVALECLLPCHFTQQFGHVCRPVASMTFWLSAAMLFGPRLATIKLITLFAMYMGCDHIALLAILNAVGEPTGETFVLNAYP